jgi:hopene-associated glycosyltransferase HpnB
MTAAEAVGWLAAAIWIYLLLGRGFFWFFREAPPLTPVDLSTRSVAVIVPARNEPVGVASAMASLVRQDFTGRLRVFLVDDHSTDGTAILAKEAAGNDGRLTVLTAAPLEAGWTGKLWAMQQGVAAAELAETFDFYLFTDADIVHAPASVTHLVARADGLDFDLVSLMVELSQNSLAERALVPAFVFFFFMLYPPSWGTGAAGGCLLIRPEALRRAGGLARIKGELIDDCSLAREVKRSAGCGKRIFLAPTRSNKSIREYRTFGEIGAMISRTAFTQLRYSWWILFGALLGLTLVYVAPPLLAVTGHVGGWIAWLAMAICYYPALRFYGRSALWAPLLPLVALFYMSATIHSALRHARGRGGQWKGRTFAGS